MYLLYPVTDILHIVCRLEVKTTHILFLFRWKRGEQFSRTDPLKKKLYPKYHVDHIGDLKLQGTAEMQNEDGGVDETNFQVTWCYFDRTSWIDYILITNFCALIIIYS